MSRVNYVKPQIWKYQLFYESNSQAQLCQFQLCKYQLCARLHTWCLKFSTETNSNLHSDPRGSLSDNFCFNMILATMVAISFIFSEWTCSSIVVDFHSWVVSWRAPWWGLETSKPKRIQTTTKKNWSYQRLRGTCSFNARSRV